MLLLLVLCRREGETGSLVFIMPSVLTERRRRDGGDLVKDFLLEFRSKAKIEVLDLAFASNWRRLEEGDKGRGSTARRRLLLRLRLRPR